MFGIKTKILKNLNNNFLSNALGKKNPKFLKKFFLKKIIISELKKDISKNNIQTPLTMVVNNEAKKIRKETADYMPNNLGNWSIKKPFSFTTKLEKEFIKFLKKSYGENNSKIAGHFGSGSTEGNIYASWIGRNYLQKKIGDENTKRIVILKNSLTHYSVDKAADLVGIKTIEVGIRLEELCFDEDDLLKKIISSYKTGVKGFIIPITLGYTVSGTEDNYKKIVKIVNNFIKENSDSYFFLWMDCSFSGAYKLFTEPNFKPFFDKNIKLITVDFHKFLAIPYPANVILYRKSLLNLISKKIPYINQLDTTLLGSRPGNSVLETWATLMFYGKRNIESEINKSIQKKESFLKGIGKEKNIIIVNPKNSLQAAVIAKDNYAQRILNKKYGLKEINYSVLFKNKKITIKINKLYFFPNLR